MFDKCAGLNTSKGKYSIIIIAPPCWKQEMTSFTLHYTGNVWSAPNFTCLVRVLTWRHLKAIFSYNYSATCWQQDTSCFAHNETLPCSICTKLHMFGKSPGLSTSKGQYYIIIIEPPCWQHGNDLFYTNLYRQCPIWPNFTCLVRVLAWKTSTCQCSVIGHSATSWQQEVWHI